MSFAWRQHVSRSMFVAAMLGLLLTVLPAFPASAATAGDLARAEARLVDKVNTERTKRGLVPLVNTVDLQSVARSWSQRMNGRQAMSHNRNLANEVHPSLWSQVGENVGHISHGGSKSLANLVDELHRQWMDSSAHRANILRPDYTHIGVGLAYSTEHHRLWGTEVFMEAKPDPGIATALKVSKALWDGETTQPEYVVLARSDVYADALGGGGLAGRRGVLLFTHGPRIDRTDPPLLSDVAAEISRVLPRGRTVYLLGGSRALGARVEKDLQAAGYQVNRLGGANRYETAAAVAEEVVRRHGPAEQVAITTGHNWPDALSAASWAAAHGSPVLLADRDTLPGPTSAFLERHRPAQRWVVGGTAVISDRVAAETGGTRVAGDGRAETAIEVARRMFGRTARGNNDQYVVALGWGGQPTYGYAAGMAGVAAHRQAPLLLADTTAVARSTRSYLEGLGYTSSDSARPHISGYFNSEVVDEINRLTGR